MLASLVYSYRTKSGLKNSKLASSAAGIILELRLKLLYVTQQMIHIKEQIDLVMIDIYYFVFTIMPKILLSEFKQYVTSFLHTFY